jgi:NTE family protein
MPARDRILRDRGRECADEWLKTNFNRIGVESTVDIEKRYL